MAAHLIDVSVASTKRLEAVVAGVGRVQQVTKEACHVESDYELVEILKAGCHVV